MSSAVLALISDSGSDLLPDPVDEESDTTALVLALRIPCLSWWLNVDRVRLSPADSSRDMSLSISTTVAVSLRTDSIGTLSEEAGAVVLRLTLFLWYCDPRTSSRDFFTSRK